MNWKDRHKATNREDAMAALANCTEEQCYCIVDGQAETSFTLLGQMSEYAACWKIPFNRDQTYRQALQFIKSENDDWESSNSCYDYGDGGWNKSYC